MVIGIGIYRIFFSISIVVGVWHSGENSALLNFSERKYAVGHTISSTAREHTEVDEVTMISSFDAEKKNREAYTRNTKLDKLKIQLFMNIVKQQYLYISVLINFLGIYRW